MEFDKANERALCNCVVCTFFSLSRLWRPTMTKTRASRITFHHYYSWPTKEQKKRSRNECTQQRWQQWQRLAFDRFVTGKWAAKIGSNSCSTFIGSCGTKVHTNTEPKFESSALHGSPHIGRCGDAFFPRNDTKSESAHITPHRLTFFHHHRLTGKWIENVLIAHLHATRIRAYSWINCVSSSTWAEKKEKTEFFDGGKLRQYNKFCVHTTWKRLPNWWNVRALSRYSQFYIIALTIFILGAQCVVLFKLTIHTKQCSRIAV